MFVHSKRIALALAGVSALAMVSFSAPTFAATGKTSAPPADVAALVTYLNNAIATAQAKPGFANESTAQQTQELEDAMTAAIAASGFDSVTADAALNQVESNRTTATSPGAAAYALLLTVHPQAQNEIQTASTASTNSSTSSTSGSSSSTPSGFAGGTGGGGGGGGGYVTGK